MILRGLAANKTWITSEFFCFSDAALGLEALERRRDTWVVFRLLLVSCERNLVIASHTTFWILSQPPARWMYAANAHWHTHQCFTGHEPPAPSQDIMDPHQLGWPVTWQKLPPVFDAISMQMWCEPASSFWSTHCPLRVKPVSAIPV